ncbi:MAG: peptidylprolyl isomerase [Pseudomonadota bacterium]
MSAAHEMHLGVAEAGKAAAVSGDHGEALRHYREALRLAVSSKAPEVFFRHYTQCVLESLEQTAAYAEIIEFCDNADAHYRATGAPTEFHRRDHGSILERLGVVLLKSGDKDRAKEVLAAAIAVAGKGRVPLAEQLHGWLLRGMTPDLRRIGEAQTKFGYFTVRADQLDTRRARPLPAADADAAPLMP